MRILLTTCSYQDTPGPHHELMEAQGWEIVRERGPLSEARMLELAGSFDAFLCGDDGMSRTVLEKSLPRLKVISKYGIGLDKIDLPATQELRIPVLFTPGVNHDTVAEHTFLLLLAITKNFAHAIDSTRAGRWDRQTGFELFEKRIGLIRPRGRSPCARVWHAGPCVRPLLARSRCGRISDNSTSVSRVFIRRGGYH
jgi:D-3-phosphoglycerate dehydrogenase